MRTTPVIAIIDIGKTNKKLLLFDQQYNVVHEYATQCAEVKDEDGDPCEDVQALQRFVLDSIRNIAGNTAFDLKAVNFSAYGASFVHVDEKGHTIGALTNYLKPYPESLQKKFYERYGGEKKFSRQTASPVLGSLNSGMQLYRLKEEKPAVFASIRYALHLPQFLSFLIMGEATSDITSIGCHTNLWDFDQNKYHRWVRAEGIDRVLAPIARYDQTFPARVAGASCPVGAGLHDSSAALIPYLVNFQEPFVLISTGTWCITLNPFNHSPLTDRELENDCLCFLHYQGSPVKASRLFAGQEHEQEVKRIAAFFGQDEEKYRRVKFNPDVVAGLQNTDNREEQEGRLIRHSLFAPRDLSGFDNDIAAYHQLMMDIVTRQKASTRLVLDRSETKRIFVDGGFGKNGIYMNLLAAAFPEAEVYAASMTQATALGAALAVHAAWNPRPLPNDLIKLQYYALSRNAV